MTRIRIFTLIILIAGIFACSEENKNISIYMIGDSTMSNKKNPEINPEHGWGQVFPEFFNEQISIQNHAVNGRSSRSFIDEGRWQAVLDELKSGDYVLIQFGHNDQKYKDSTRFTNPYTGYRRNLEKFVKETREKGANPVLLSSIVRRKFNEFGTLEDTHGVYPFIVREVAREMDVPFIDLQLKTEDLVISLGPEKSKELYLWIKPGENDYIPNGREDNTHLNYYGAKKIAGLAVEGIKELELPLVKYLK